MTRTPKPSEVFRLSEQTPLPQVEHPAPRRRWWPLGVGVVAVVAVLAVVAGPGGGLAGIGGLDVTREDEAVAALGLFLAEQRAAAELGSHHSILRPPGPDEAERAARAHADAVQGALVEARAHERAGPEVVAYWSDPAHDAFVHRLRGLGESAADIALLAAVHDTLYAGAGLVASGDAEQALVNRFRAGRPSPPELTQWSDALLAQLEGHEAGAHAAAGRAAVEGHWSAAASTLQPPGVETLRAYVGSLPPQLVEALRGHPVAGPALARLGG